MPHHLYISKCHLLFLYSVNFLVVVYTIYKTPRVSNSIDILLRGDVDYNEKQQHYCGVPMLLTDWDIFAKAKLENIKQREKWVAHNAGVVF